MCSTNFLDEIDIRYYIYFQMIFVHIGAGAGDKDPTSNYRDGFSEFVKKYPIKDINKKIYLVEANPRNIKKLKDCWKNFKNVHIFNKAIVHKKIKKNKIKLYYCKEDGPHFQVMSSSYKHVKKHFHNAKILYIYVKTLKIDKFLNDNFKNKIIESFSIDIEGLDFDVLMELNLNKIVIKNLSFEYLHLNKSQKKKIIKKLISNGYSYNGFGIDHNNFDFQFTKKINIWNNFLVNILPYVSTKHYFLINKLLKKI